MKMGYTEMAAFELQQFCMIIAPAMEHVGGGGRFLKCHAAHTLCCYVNKKLSPPTLVKLIRTGVEPAG